MLEDDLPDASGLDCGDAVTLTGEVLASEPLGRQLPDATLLLEPGPSGLAEGAEAETAGRELEPSESGEGASQRTGPKRSEELLLKNRKAQRRFRERQKSKITELEEKNAEVVAELKRVQQENQNLDSKLAALVRLLHQRNIQLEQFKAGQAVGILDTEAAASFTDDLLLSWSEGQTFSLTPEQVRSLKREDLIKIWREYVQQLATCLGEFDTHPNSQSVMAERIKRLTQELTMLLLRVSICSPLVAKSFGACRMEEPNMPKEDEEGMWRSIVSTLMLSSEQRSELVHLRQLFLNKLNSILEQRAEVLSGLYDTIQLPPAGHGEIVSCLQYIKAHEAANLLRQTLKEDHALKLDFVSTVLKHLISPIQLARCLVQSYPWFPDTLALTTFLAAEAGDTQAMSFFAVGRASALPAMFPVSSFPRLMTSRGNSSGFSTPRNATPTTPQRTTAAQTPFQMSGQHLSPGGASWAGLGGLQLRTQHSGHSGLSGMQYTVSPVNSPLYTPLSPSPAPSPPLSPSHAIMPGLPKPPPSQQNL